MTYGFGANVVSACAPVSIAIGFCLILPAVGRCVVSTHVCVGVSFSDGCCVADIFGAIVLLVLSLLRLLNACCISLEDLISSWQMPLRGYRPFLHFFFEAFSVIS